ncbi:DUF3035 domain-containing protein [Marimonas arenosa]|uniref:DUF3035 domain-containing protein n=1 Tax=Marimonas arenosa TaxID=1795305 RepID=A0AAE3WB91_9RHOB|nr:DUF3035 domain-containing protein [Marimonas arenosa]MDQ2089514.1 DUF3035 domain-containing protein [Marimonas arenosa]
MRKRIAILMMTAMGLSACAGYERDITLRDMRPATPGPDEFSILPGKPLQEPPSFTALPAPTPGAANLTDQNPMGDGVAALGGKPARLQDTGVPRSDTALVAHASRNGVDPNVRAELAAADEDFRRRKSRFTRIRIVRQDLYNQVYKRETLNARREWNRYRRAGARTPTAPPPQR